MRNAAQIAAADQFKAVADRNLKDMVAAVRGDLSRDADAARVAVATKGLLQQVSKAELETLLAVALIRIARA